jgi:hypothetical protein
MSARTFVHGRPAISGVRLFISSTFEDMQDERRTLLEIGLPIVRVACERAGASFHEVDLRWSISAGASLRRKQMLVMSSVSVSTR